MNILVTGAAGFIGFHLAKALVERGHKVLAVDSVNEYYDPVLKWNRLGNLGINPGPMPPLPGADATEVQTIASTIHPNLKFIRCRLESHNQCSSIFRNHKFDLVCHLAAQAGVRHSIKQPLAYTQANLVAFTNILEGCHRTLINRLIYASSSSVYGLNSELPFREDQPVNRPANFYAATKSANELMAYSYSHLFGLHATALRFFTVFGPWGRPDMALFKFTRAAMQGKAIEIYNNGDMFRDFTYIDDIIQGLVKMLEAPSLPRARAYNLGSGRSIPLMHYIAALEEHLDMKIQKKYLPMQKGDIHATQADISRMVEEFQYQPVFTIREAVGNFVKWYIGYYGRN